MSSRRLLKRTRLVLRYTDGSLPPSKAERDRMEFSAAEAAADEFGFRPYGKGLERSGPTMSDEDEEEEEEAKGKGSPGRSSDGKEAKFESSPATQSGFRPYGAGLVRSGPTMSDEEEEEEEEEEEGKGKGSPGRSSDGKEAKFESPPATQSGFRPYGTGLRMSGPTTSDEDEEEVPPPPPPLPRVSTMAIRASKEAEREEEEEEGGGGGGGRGNRSAPVSWGEFLLRRWGLSDAYAYADHTTGAARDGDSDNDSDFEILDIFVPRQKGASSHTSRAGSPMRGRSSKSPARHRSRSRDRGAPRQLQPSAFSQAAAANAILAHASPEHDPNQSSQQGRRHSSGVGGDGDGDDYDYDYEVPGTPESSGTDLYDSDDQEDEETVSESPPLLEPSTQAVRQAEAVVHEGPTQAEQSDEFRRSVGVLSMSRAATLAQDEAARERAARKRYIAEAKKQVFHPVELYGNKTLYTSGPATERDLLRDEDTEGAYMDLIQQSANHDWHIKQFPYALSVRASGQQVVISKLLQIDGWNCSWREELTVSIYDFMRMVGEIHTWRVPLLFGYLAAEAYVSTGRPGGRPLLRIRLSDIVPLTSHSNAHARTFQRMVVIHERALVDTDYIPLRISDTDEKLTWAHVVSQAREYDGRHDTLQRLVDDDILRQYMHRLGIARALLSRTSPFAASSSLAAAAAAGAGA